MLSRFAFNMNPIGIEYQNLLGIMFGQPTKNIRAEIDKLGKVGYSLGKLVRIAISFDLFDKYDSPYAEFLLEDDEDFDD